MSKSKTGTASTISEGQKFEFSGAVMRQMPRILDGANPARIQSFINNQNALVMILREAITGVPIGVPEPDHSALRADWQEFYEKVFGLVKDFPNLAIPLKPEGDWRLLIVAEGMTPEKLYGKCKELFPSWKYADNLNTVVSDRKTDKDYCVWVRDRVEADEEMKNLSANDLARTDLKGITLEERLVYELKYFRETGSHLDAANWTLCTGSRVRDGGVPGVYWSRTSGEMDVYWYNPDNRRDCLRTRVAVS
jgi:hypothetical protein